MILASLLLAATPASDLTVQLLAVERGFYEGWRDKTTAPFERGLGEGAVAFGSFGAIDRKAQIEGQAQSNKACAVKAFSLNDPASVRVSSDAAVLYYRLHQEATCGGHAVPAGSYNTSVYALRGGRWVNVFRTFAPDPGN